MAAPMRMKLAWFIADEGQVHFYEYLLNRLSDFDDFLII